MKTYTTKSGDMWDSIAKEQMGNEKYMSLLVTANENYSGTIIFSAGVIINIPDIKEEIPQYVPPWRKWCLKILICFLIQSASNITNNSNIGDNRVNITYSPNINIKSDSKNENLVNNVKQALTTDKENLIQLIQKVLKDMDNDKNRLAFN